MLSQEGTGQALWSYHRKLLIASSGKNYGLLFGCAASAAVGANVALIVNSSGEVRYVAEAIVPILAALLAAFSFTPELSSGNLGLMGWQQGFQRRVILPRVLTGIGLAFLLEWLTLITLSAIVPSSEILPALLAALPSAWALSLLALTGTLLFRNAVSGFLMAVAVWLLNLALGYGVHPLLGLQGFYAANDRQPLGQLWIIGKGALLLSGGLLLLAQRRWLLGRRAPLRAEPLTVGLVLLLMVGLYTLSGAVSVVSYAYLTRGSDETATSERLRVAMQPFQFVGIPALFGPAFQAYLAVTPEGFSADEHNSRRRELEAALARWPNSVWADNIAIEAAAEAARTNPVEGRQAYYRFYEAHPNSPLARAVLLRIIRLEMSHLPPNLNGRRQVLPGSPEGHAAAHALTEKYPSSSAAQRAAEYLETHY